VYNYNNKTNYSKLKKIICSNSMNNEILEIESDMNEDDCMCNSNPSLSPKLKKKEWTL